MVGVPVDCVAMLTGSMILAGPIGRNDIWVLKIIWGTFESLIHNIFTH